MHGKVCVKSAKIDELSRNSDTLRKGVTRSASRRHEVRGWWGKRDEPLRERNLPTYKKDNDGGQVLGRVSR